MNKAISIGNLLLLLLVFCVGFNEQTKAQTPNNADYTKKYTLSEVVVFSRHNIRSPLATKGSVIERITPHQWYPWTSEAGCLSLKGGVMETMMGQYFHKWLVSEGLFEENAMPDSDEIRVYTNSMQRTIATARYFLSGFMPVANIPVEHHCTIGTMDSIFTPQITRIDDEFCTTAFQQIAEMNGEKAKMHKVSPNEYYCVLNKTGKKLAENYSKICSVLDIKESPACLQGDTCRFTGPDTIWLRLNDEPRTTGTLKSTCKASDALVLQYYEERDDLKAAFGHAISYEEWLQISGIKIWYDHLLFTAPIVSKQIATPILNEIAKELNTPKRKFAFLCGHDSNIGSMLAALGVSDYTLPNTVESKTPIGSKIVFEKWVDKSGNSFVSVSLVYHSTAQIRQGSCNNSDIVPIKFPVRFKNLTTNADGLYALDDILKILNQL